jgi:uncharacterized protein with GYD domain
LIKNIEEYSGGNNTDACNQRITKDCYEEKLKEYNKRQEEITEQLNKITKSDENYYITMGYVFQLAQHAYDLFLCSEMEERRQIINLVFVSMNGEKLEYTMYETFELLRNLDECTAWGQLLDQFLNLEIDFTINFQNIEKLLITNTLSQLKFTN